MEDNETSAGNSANGGAPEVLTFGSSLIIDQTGVSGIIGTTYDDAAASNIVNDGTINAQAGTLYIVSGGTHAFGFTNDGAITVSAGTLEIEPTTFTNAAGGSITADGGTTLYIGTNTATAWSNAGTVTIDSGAKLYMWGTFTTASLAGFTDNSATTYLDGTLTNTGATLALGSGGTFAPLTLVSGTIVGGTITDAGSGMVFDGGTLQGPITYEGTMNLTPASSSVIVTGSLTTAGGGTSYLTVTGVGGTGPGAINIGSNDYLYFDDSQTLNNATVTLGGTNAYVEDNETSAGNSANGGAPEVLTFGSSLIIDQTGVSGIIGTTYDDAAASNIVNDGTINAQAGTLYIVSGGTHAFGFTNDGAITVSAGTLEIEPTTFTNAAGGSITADGGTTLYIGTNTATAWSNAGTVTIDSGAKLYMWGTFTTASLAGFTDNSATTYLDGTLTNTGATLALGSGGTFAPLTLVSGTIVGGTITDAGSGMVFDGGTLQGPITYEGTMNLTPASSSVIVTGSLTTAGGGTSYLTVTGVGGTGPGAINIGSNDYLYFDDSQTLNNATVTLGGTNAYVEDNETSAGNSANGGAPEVLTFGSSLIIDQTGVSGIIGTTYDDAAASNIVNDGTINAQAGTLYIVSGGTHAFGFTNDGAIVISGGATAYIEPTTFNNGTGTLAFSGAGTLELGSSVTSFTETVGGFNAGDVFDLKNLTYASTNSVVWTQTTTGVNAAGTLAIYNGATLLETLNLAGTYSTADFVPTKDGSNDLEVTWNPVSIVAGATATFTGGGAPVTLDGALTVTDTKSTTLASATVSISSGLLPGDTLNFTNQNGISGSYNTATGVLTLSGSASVANYQSALNSITYSFSPSNGDPTGGGSDTNRTISWAANDGTFTGPVATSTLDTINSGPQTDEWINTTGANGAIWTDTVNATTNWSLATVPTSSDNVLIDKAGIYTVTIPNSASATAASVTLDSADATLLDQGSLTLGGALTINAGGIQLANNLSVTGLANFSNDATVIIENNATFALAAADGSLSITFDGLGGTLAANGPVTGGATPGIVATSAQGAAITLDVDGVASTGADAIDVTDSGGAGDISITADGAVIGAINGIDAIQSGSGNLTISGSGNISGQAGDGITAEQGATGLAGILIDGTGDVTGAGSSSIGILAEILNGADSANMTIDQTGNISGGQTAIEAVMAGSGDVSVTTGSGATITGTTLYGIYETSTGTGSMSVTTGANTNLTSASAGMFVINNAAAIPQADASQITVTADGTINSGATNETTGYTPAGISVGYAGTNTTPDLNVFGSINVQDAANITAAAGYGIKVADFGNGSIIVGELSGATVTGVSGGILAQQVSDGSGDVNIDIASGATVSGQTGITGVVTGSGTLTITNYGTVIGTSASGAAISATGVGSFTINNYGAITSAAGSGTTGSVASGGTAFINDYGTITSAASQTVGGSTGHTATLTVSGATAHFDVTGTSSGMIVGNAGVGYMYVEGGSIFTSSFLTIAAGVGGQGTVTLEGSGTSVIATTNGILVGNYGNASLTVESGASVTGFMNIAQQTGSTGTVTIEGLGTSFTATTGTYQDILDGNSGAASLFVEDLAVVTLGAGVTVGNNYESGITDSIDVNNATLNVGTYLVIGNSGSGTGTIENGAAVSVGSGLSIGYNAGSTGEVTVSAASVTVSNNGIGIGNYGTASLTIEDNAIVTTTSVNIANSFESGVVDTLVVDDATLNISGYFTVGTGGDASATIRDGATVSAGSVGLANNAGSTGTLTVTGTGTEVTAPSLNFGAGSGTLTIASGATFDVTGSVTGNGTITIESGGTFEAPSAITQTLDFSGTGGTLDLVGIQAKSAVVSGSTLTVTETNNSTLTYTVAGALAGNAFTVAGDGHGGSDLTLEPIGYLWATTGAVINAPGQHLYAPHDSVNGNADAAIIIVGSTPSASYNPAGPDSVTESVALADPFFLPYDTGFQPIDNGPLVNIPALNKIIFPNLTSTTTEGIGIYETEDASGDPVLNRAIINYPNGANGTPSYTSSVIEQLSLPGTMYGLDVSSTGSPMTSYSVAWDLYNATTQTFNIYLSIFNPSTNNSNITGGYESIFTQTGVTNPNSESWSLRSAGALKTDNLSVANLLVMPQANGGVEDIVAKGYMANGTVAPGVNFTIAPNLSNFAAGATNQIINPDIQGETALQYTPNAVSGSGFSVAWSEQVNDANGTHYQVEFAIFKPNTENASGVETSGTLVSQSVFQVDAQDVKVGEYSPDGVTSDEFLAYGTATSTTIVEFNQSGTEIASVTDPSPTGGVFSGFDVSSDGLVSVTYNGGSEDTTDIYDFRQTGLNNPTLSTTESNYIRGTQYTDLVTGAAGVDNFYYYVGEDTVGQSSHVGPSDTFNGGSTGQWNAAVFAEPRSDYTIAASGGGFTVTYINPDDLHSGGLTVDANVTALVFNPSQDPTPTTTGLVVTNGETVTLLGPTSISMPWTIDGGGTLEFSAGAVSNLQTLDFSGTGGTLDLVGIQAKSAVVSGSTLTVTETNNSTLTYTVAGALSGNAFTVAGDGHGGSDLTLEPIGYLWATTGAVINAPGQHLYAPHDSVNGNADAAIIIVGSTPSASYNPAGPDSVTESVALADPFFLPYDTGFQPIDNGPLVNIPALNKIIFPNLTSTTTEGIGIYETEDASGDPVLNRAIINYPNGANGTPSYTSSVIEQLSLPGTMYGLDVSSTGSPMTSYSVAWDLYNATTQTFNIYLSIFNPSTNNSNITGGYESIFTQTGVTNPNSESWSLRSAGALKTDNLSVANLLVMPQANGGVEDIVAKGYMANGTVAPGVNFTIAPNLSNFAAGATNQIINPDIQGETALQYTPNAVSGSGFSVAWSEQVNDANGTHYQVEFAIFKPNTENASGVETSGTLVSQSVFQVDAQDVKVGEYSPDGVTSDEFLAYGTATSTTIVEFNQSGTEIASVTDPSPTGGVFSGFDVSSDGLVSVTYNGGSEDTTDIYDFRQTGLNNPTLSTTESNYIRGTQYTDLVTATSGSVNNIYYYVGENTVGQSSHVGPSDTFNGGGNTFLNEAVFGDARSDYVISTPPGGFTVTYANAADLHSGSLSVNNVGVLAFDPSQDPSPTTINGNTALVVTSGETLTLLNPLTFSFDIAGLSASDVLELEGFDANTTATAGSYIATTGTTVLTVSDSTNYITSLSLTLVGNYSSSTFDVTSDGSGGVYIVDPPAPTTTIATGTTFDIDAPSNEIVTFAGGTGSLVLNDPQGFTGQIVGFTGTAPDAAHSDTIDLVGINYNSAQFAETYNSTTGLLTVTDGSHSASVTFDAFNATLDFASDGNGGTLITDPPVTNSATNASAPSSVTSEDGHGATPIEGAQTPDSHGDFSLDATNHDSASVSGGFAFMSPSGEDQFDLVFGRALTQPHDTSFADIQNTAATPNQPESVSIGGPGNDHFVFAPSVSTEFMATLNPRHDTTELNHSAETQAVQELQSLITTDVHGDAIINPTQHDGITLPSLTASQVQQLIHSDHVLLH